LSRFKIFEQSISGLKLIKRELVEDSRGFLSRLFCADELEAAGWNKQIKQVNYTRTSNKGAVRGLHFQLPPKSEMKLVSCIRGEIFDVAVDVRKGSRTFLNWHAEVLTENNNSALLIPEGFAHGFQALTENVELLYMHSEVYDKKYDYGFNVHDPMIGIRWPLSVVHLSEKDSKNLLIGKDFQGIIV
jgi:dTDP-4-dehydrorhamnose 3,5-epimerase